ncbi:cellulose biosynthesis cyclic di-GMP-binding regulatory protein BcsB [Clostridium carnis]
MRNLIKKLTVVLSIIFIILLATNINNRVNAEGLTNEIITKSQDIGNDVVLRGVFSGHSIYFNVDKWQNIENIQGEIQIDVNELINKVDETYITFSLNGTPFYSQQLRYDSSKEIQNIKINFPKDKIKVGNNEFKIEGYCRVSEKPCTDDVNNANWLVIKDSSKINISYRDKISENNLSSFPYPFQKSTTIVLGENYTDDDFAAALMLSAYLGKYKDYNGEIVKYNELKKDISTNLIFIGGKDKLPKEIVSSIKEVDTVDLDSNGLIKIIKSPFVKKENIKAMVVISNDKNLLLKGIKILMNEELISQSISEVPFIINSNIQEEVRVKKSEENITFESLGLKEILMKGPFRRSSSISYLMPKNKVLSKGDKIKLNFRYSENLDFKRSLITVYINNTPIGSKKLEKEKTLSDEVELNIPNDVMNSNYIEVKIAFDLEQTDSYCEKRQEESPWALITGDSYLYIQGKDNSSVNNFEKLPSPFIYDKTFNDILLIIPDKLSSQELTSIGKMVSYMGSEINNNIGILEVLRSSNLNGKEKDMNLIIYGTPNTNSIIKDLNKSLWFKYNDSFDRFISNEKLYLLDDFATNIATFQLDISPYNPRKSMLIMTSPKEELLNKSLAYLYNEKLNSKLIGDCAVIDENGDLRTFKFKKEETVPVYEKIIKLTNKDKGLVGVVLLMGVFIIVSIILYFNKNKKSKH